MRVAFRLGFFYRKRKQRRKLGGGVFLQGWIEDDVRKEQDPLAENEADADGERPARRFTAAEQIMVQDPRLGPLPLVKGKADENDEADNERGEDAGVGPAEQAAAQVEPRQEQGQAGREEAEAGKVEVAQFLPDGQVVEARVPFGGPVADEDPDGGCAPECHLDPLWEGKKAPGSAAP